VPHATVAVLTGGSFSSLGPIWQIGLDAHGKSVPDELSELQQVAEGYAMANKEHLARLKQGVEVWNAWRNEGRRKRPNLRGANLAGANLAGADLRWANLSAANLRAANLRVSDLRAANLREANLSGAQIGWTSLGNIDLSVVQGLDAVLHAGPSSIGIDTLYRSHGNIPESFLRGAGVPDEMISYSKSLVGQPFEYYSCFISYSSRDKALAQRLHADLQAQGVRCWFAPEDLKIGDEIRSVIDASIQVYDRLLLILSKYSVKSHWVQKEVETAFEKEGKENRIVLFPIRIDEAIMHVAVGWAADIRRQRHIGDFTQWKEHGTYQQAFARLLRDLKAAETQPEGSRPVG
jgi:TIR domain/Pentapeptide repeats (8 copies)